MTNNSLLELFSQLTFATLCTITTRPSRFVIGNVLGNVVAFVTGLRTVLAQPWYIHGISSSSTTDATRVRLTIVLAVLARVVVHHLALVLLKHVFEALFGLVTVHRLVPPPLDMCHVPLEQQWTADHNLRSWLESVLQNWSLFVRDCGLGLVLVVLVKSVFDREHRCIPVPNGIAELLKLILQIGLQILHVVSWLDHHVLESNVLGRHVDSYSDGQEWGQWHGVTHVRVIGLLQQLHALVKALHQGRNLLFYVALQAIDFAIYFLFRLFYWGEIVNIVPWLLIIYDIPGVSPFLFEYLSFVLSILAVHSVRNCSWVFSYFVFNFCMVNRM